MSSEIKADKWSPASGTAGTIGDSGDTFTVPTGVGLTVTDEVKTNKISPASGTAFTLGDSGDTFTVPSGVTFANSGTATGFGALVYVGGQSVSSNTAQINFDGVFTATYRNYLFVWDATTNTDGADVHFNFRTTAPANYAANYYSAVNVLDHLGNNDAYVQNNATTFILAQGPYNQSSVDFPASSGYCIINNPFSSSFRATLQMQNAFHTTNGDFRFGAGGCYVNNQTQFAGFSVSASANDINNMTGKVYGMVDS